MNELQKERLLEIKQQRILEEQEFIAKNKKRRSNKAAQESLVSAVFNLRQAYASVLGLKAEDKVLNNILLNTIKQIKELDEHCSAIYDRYKKDILK